jgi:hypothetical protein
LALILPVRKDATLFAPKATKSQTKTAADSANSLARQRSADPPSLTARGSGVSWDFSDIPVFPPDRANRTQALFPFAGPLLPGAIQAKPVVGSAGDPLGYEADLVAGQVNRETAVSSPPPPSNRGGWSFANIALTAPGEQVPEGVRNQFEQRTGASLASVRVHRDTPSQFAASALQARAFTIGQDIHFAGGEFQPGTPEGDHLLAHELTHTVQQRAAAPTPQLASVVSKPEDRAEEEADDVADAVTADHDESEEFDESEHKREIPAIVARSRPIALAPKKKAKSKPAKAAPATKPKPIAFSLFSTKFKATVDGTGKVTVNAVKKADGWTFTAAGANTVAAERTIDNAEYVDASGSSEPLIEKTTITVPAGGPATVVPIVAVLGDPAKLTLPLSGSRRAAKRKSVTVNGVAVEQLDLPATAITFTPADGDAIHLELGGDAWVFTTLKQDPVAPATTTTDLKGFFEVGYFTRYNDRGKPTFGTATPSTSETVRQTTIENLGNQSTITTEEADAFKTVSVIESDFAGVQTYDSGILSFGIAQWTVNADLPRMLAKVAPSVFEHYLGRYGLAVGAPVRQLDAFVAQFSPGSRARGKLGVRNLSEDALFLNGHELVTKALLAEASSRAKAFDTLAGRASALKADVVAAKPKLISVHKAEKSAAATEISAAKKKIRALYASLRGLPGRTTDSDPEKQADILFAVATNAHKAAQEVIDNCDSSQVMRGSEWALRFEMLGHDPGGQTAELAQMRETFTKLKGQSVHGGATFGKLLPNDRGRAALLSSFFNTPAGTEKGMGNAVAKFKVQKKAEAKTATAAALAAKLPVPLASEADWTAFPWKAGDARWTTLWPAAVDDFETLAIVEITSGTTDPARRRKIIGNLFP